jgi:RES domain-containing protein
MFNKIGVKAVYCSENISLALLEYYVHSVNLALQPESIMLAKIHIP